MKTIKVQAAAGLKFPLEHNPRKYVEQKPIEVPDSTYYQRGLASGDLVLLAEKTPEEKTPDPVPETKAKAKPAAKEEDKENGK